MEVLWEAAPKTAGEVIKALRPTRDWADNTVRTLLSRLVDKEALSTDKNTSGVRTYEPAISRDVSVQAEGESFLGRVFGGAAKPLLAHFASQSNLTAAEVEELKKILDESVERKGE